MIAGKVSSSDMEAYNNEAFKNYNDKALDPCPNCGRTFLPDRLTIHLRSCNKAFGKPDTSGSPSKAATMGGGSGGMGGSGMS